MVTAVGRSGLDGVLPVYRRTCGVRVDSARASCNRLTDGEGVDVPEPGDPAGRYIEGKLGLPPTAVARNLDFTTYNRTVGAVLRQYVNVRNALLTGTEVDTYL